MAQENNSGLVKIRGTYAFYLNCTEKNLNWPLAWDCRGYTSK